MSDYLITYSDGSEKTLMHYGVQGMKWGIRRYQNPDGTLTNAGKKRYYKGLSEIGRDPDIKKSAQYAAQLYKNGAISKRDIDKLKTLETEKKKLEDKASKGLNINYNTGEMKVNKKYFKSEDDYFKNIDRISDLEGESNSLSKALAEDALGKYKNKKVKILNAEGQEAIAEASLYLSAILQRSVNSKYS